MAVNPLGPNFPRLPAHLQGILDDTNSALDDRLVRLLAEGLRPRDPVDDLEARKAELSLYEFVRQAWHVLEPDSPFKPGWHIGCICSHLEAVSSLQIRNLVVNIPPRHGKSLITSVMWFVWSWLKEPWTRWVFTSYAASLSERDSEKCRTLIRSKWFQDRWPDKFHIKPRQDTIVKFVNDREGYRIATSVGGIGTGEGGSFIVADDPSKTDEVLSQPALERVIQNWSQTMSTRGNDPKRLCKVIIMQRLAENDLSGYVMSNPLGYEALILPAEYEPARYFFLTPPLEGAPPQKAPRDSIQWTSLQTENPRWRDNHDGSGRKEEGDPLWPAQFGRAELKSLKAELRAVGTAGQLQQRPSPVTGSIFRSEYFRYFKDQPTPEGLQLYTTDREGRVRQTFYAHDCRWFQACDTAMKVESTSAWTAVATVCVTPARQLFVWDVWRERLLVPEQYPALMQLRQGRGVWDGESHRWRVLGLLNPWPCPLLYQAVEDKASGIGLIQQAALEGRPFRVLKADRDKVSRAALLATLFEAGSVYFRESGRSDWLTDLEDELKSFPRGAFADQVDILSYSARIMTEDSLVTGHVRGDLIADAGGPTPAPPEEGKPAFAGRDDIDLDFMDDDRNDAWWRR